MNTLTEPKLDIQIVLHPPKKEPTLFLDEMTEDDIEETIETVYGLFDTYFQEKLLSLSSPKCYVQLTQEVADVLCEEWENAVFLEDEDYDEIVEFIESLLEAYHVFSDIPQRSIATRENITTTTTKISNLTQTIERLRAIPQPKQRSPEWYTFRNGLLSASNLWKVFASEAQVNSLIYEKCRPAVEYSTYTNLESSMHWGVKYEPVSVMLYEAMFSAKVEEFGCIQHPKYPFVGASPDGIVTDPRSTRYGRMLEIKNIVNRDITGIPKEEYWVQTQIQMETCDLDECDFLETRFLEYSDAAAFYADEQRDYKGVLLHFIQQNSYDTAPVYKYMPIDVVCDQETVAEWIERSKVECRGEGLALLNTLYWYLEEMSCVLIERNQAWFSTAIPKIEAVWKTIVEERQTGYQHRASKSAKARSGSFQIDDKIIISSDTISMSRSIRNMPVGNSICLIKLEE
jgi:putative phage-type endonuclease